MSTTARIPGERPSASGLAYAIASYVLWGGLPLYFLLLVPSGPFEVVAARVVFSLAFCLILLTATRGWAAFLAVARNPRILLTMGLAAALIYANWQVYVAAVLNGQVIEAALGYFINPIVTVLLGVLVLRERMRPAQWIAIGISLIAVVVLAVGYGQLPWIALVLAFSFGFYGLIKKQVGARVDAVSGLTLETAWLLPVAVVILVVVAATTGIEFGQNGIGHALLMAGTGIATPIPLLLFAAAARRLPLVYTGFVQFFAPVLQFIVGVAVLHEPMPPERWLGFGLVWVALVVLTTDMVISARGQRGAGLVEPV